jgi:hypothetical protein
MANLRVDPHGLGGFAASCADKAATVRTALAKGSSGPGFQASSAAVMESDSRVAAASKRLGERIDDMASKLSSAAADYVGRDGESANAIDRAAP